MRRKICRPSSRRAYRRPDAATKSHNTPSSPADHPGAPFRPKYDGFRGLSWVSPRTALLVLVQARQSHFHGLAEQFRDELWVRSAILEEKGAIPEVMTAHSHTYCPAPRSGVALRISPHWALPTC